MTMSEQAKFDCMDDQSWVSQCMDEVDDSFLSGGERMSLDLASHPPESFVLPLRT